MPVNLGNQFAWFGDGNTMQIVRKEKYIDDNGISKYKFMLIASKTAIDMYGLRMDKELKYLEGYPIYIRNYSDLDVIPIAEYSNFSRYFIKCNIKGEETTVHRQIEDDKIALESLQKSYRKLQTENARLHDEMKMMSTDQEQWMKHISKVVTEARRMSKQIKDEEETTSQEGVGE